MTSIRRTLSPANQDRKISIGGAAPFSPLSISSPSLKGFPGDGSGKWFSSSHLVSSLARVLSVPFVPNGSRKGGWRRPLFRCLLCFLLGSLLGAMLFSRVEDSRIHDYFSFEIKPPHINEGNADAAKSKGGEVILDAVNFGVETRAVDKISARFDFVPRKQIIVVTPTYSRAMQAYYLNRLSQTLRLVQAPLLWIVVEIDTASFQTAEMLRKTGVLYRHLVWKNNMTNVKDKRVHQRNTALEHIELHKLDGIVYFADEENIYSVELFGSLREIRRFGTWPIAALAPGESRAIIEGPVCSRSQVLGWHTNEKSKTTGRFHADMSGFAFNSTILWDPKRWRRPFLNQIRQSETLEGFQESSFMVQLVEDESQMEGILHGCSRIFNWNLHLQDSNLVYPKGWQLQENLDADIPLQ